MTRSIEELITENVVTELQRIATDAGYVGDVAVQRAKLEGNDVNSSTITVIDGDLRLNDEQSLGRDRWIKAYTIVCPIKSAYGSDQSHGTQTTSIRANVYKAMMQDYQRGGFAVDTRFTSARSDMSPDAPTETLEFEVHFFTNKDDPWSNEDIT